MAVPSTRTILTDALQEIGAIGQGEVPSAADAALGLLRFQNQLDSWQADNLTLYNFTQTQYTLTSGTVTRTIGPSGNITTSQNPVFINGINYIVPSSSPGVEVPMGQMDSDQYMNLSIKNLPSNLPTQWYFNKGTVNGTLTFWPVVTQNDTIAIYWWAGVGVPVGLDDQIVGPPGYAEAFMYNLALRLVTPFARPMPPMLPQMAASTLMTIKRTNTQPGLLGLDQALIPTTGGAYNIYADTHAASSSR